MLASREGVYMFSTNTNLTLIAEAPSLYMDGTFQIYPHLFYQVFTIHAFKYGKQFPLVYFLLPGKFRWNGACADFVRRNGYKQDSNKAKNFSSRCDVWHYLKLEPCDEGPGFQRQHSFGAYTLHTGWPSVSLAFEHQLWILVYWPTQSLEWHLSRNFIPVVKTQKVCGKLTCIR